MGKELKIIAQKFRETKKIQKPLLVKIYSIQTKSNQLIENVDNVDRQIRLGFNYLIGNSLDRKGGQIGDERSITKAGIHDTGGSYYQIDPTEENIKISEDKKTIRIIDSSNSKKDSAKIPLNYFQSDMRGKIIEVIELIEKYVNIKTTHNIDEKTKYHVRRHQFYNKEKSYYLSLGELINIVEDGKNRKPAQDIVDLFPKMERKCFKPVREKIEFGKEIVKTIKQYSIPFRMMEKLKRNS